LKKILTLLLPYIKDLNKMNNSLQIIFTSLEDPKDIFKYINDWKPDDNEYFVCYKIMCEYGIIVIINDINGNELNRLFVNTYKNEEFSSKEFYGDELYNFIKSDKLIDFLPNTIFVNIPKNALICDSCNAQIIPLENQCDFCDRKMCETCQMNSYYSFHYCNECGTNYCYYNGLGDDYKCLKAKYSGRCWDCGF